MLFTFTKTTTLIILGHLIGRRFSSWKLSIRVRRLVTGGASIITFTRKKMVDNSRHRVKLLEILKDIYDDPQLRTALGFKGGTAAMLFYDLPRLSVDLDFDLLKEGREELVVDKLKKILANHGTLRETTKKRFTLFFLLSYELGERTIKVEISRRATESGFSPQTYLGIPMLVMNQEDMTAGKLSAL